MIPRLWKRLPCWPNTTHHTSSTLSQGLLMDRHAKIICSYNSAPLMAKHHTPHAKHHQRNHRALWWTGMPRSYDTINAITGPFDGQACQNHMLLWTWSDGARRRRCAERWIWAGSCRWGHPGMCLYVCVCVCGFCWQDYTNMASARAGGGGGEERGCIGRHLLLLGSIGIIRECI